MSKKMGFFVFKPDSSAEKVNAILPMVDVVASLVIAEGRILHVWNEKWGSFALPTTKRRSWEDPNAVKGSVREEDWEDACIRAAAEALGRTITEQPEEIGEIPEFQQSDRDGAWKRYRLRAYRFEFDSAPEVHPVRIHEWLSVEQVLDDSRRPISPTARHVISELQLKGVIE
ncbi:MAG: hypothetical protein GWM98_06820 [Nitrospinaceae bacterium]|nr:hypothetical protein [Nitrospinaceae bacterium]